MNNEQRRDPQTVTLDDKWVVEDGRVVINGTQALARILLAQREFDRRHGLDTAGYITGYRGSPLGNVDTTLWSIGDRLAEAGIVFRPGVNEDIAATAIRGTQQIDAVPGARHQGVFAAWYGKGPGVDRSGDAFKHGNYAGTHPLGGVLAFYGDDHAGKSSTVAHQSEQAMAANLIPSLYPSNVQEMIDYGLTGYALSRYSGSWVGIKCVNEIAEQTATVELDLSSFATIAPLLPDGSAPGSHIRQGVFDPLGEERIVVEQRLPLVRAFVRANAIDRTIFRAERPMLGLVTAGKSFNDVRAALELLGLTDERAATLGISLYKVGCIWPLEPEGLAAFARDHHTLFVIEEKKAFLEQQAAAVLINDPERPLLIGKQDERGRTILSSSTPFDPLTVAHAIASRLDALGLGDRVLDKARTLLPSVAPVTSVMAKRTPFFCSGCPHNRSTRLPEGSLSMTGIGCHTMANFVRPKEALLPTQMGGEGGNWIGLAPFTDTPHMFQNMGDGTYYHSGLLAIRAAVAAGVNITYKILYNDAVAMTGGQPVDGPISVAEIAQQVRHEGVTRIAILSDDPCRHEGGAPLPAGTTVDHRDELDAIQRELRHTPGCTVLIYEQTCAAEKRRRRKRGTFPDPQKRLFISKAVCEGCGDCSAQSTCVSLIPIETEFGTKRAIDQSSCNKDFSCLNGFCPSFVTIYDAEPRKPVQTALADDLFAGLPEPDPAPIDGSSYNIMVAGIGGTGVVTVGALLGMAAHCDGLAMSLFDMTGLAQKNGAVYSHVRIARSPADITTQRLRVGQADTLLAFDLVAALAPEATTTLSARTRIIANASIMPTVAFQFDRDFTVDPQRLLADLGLRVGEAPIVVDASSVALAVFGDTVAANLFLVGVALQRGMLPFGSRAVEQAIFLNKVAVPLNLRALSLGRLFAVDPGKVLALTRPVETSEIARPASLADIVNSRVAHLEAYQGKALAERYRQLVEHVRRNEQRVCSGSDRVTIAVAWNYARLLAYKDEYEVARLLTSPSFLRELDSSFAKGGRLALNLAPPFLNGKRMNGRPKKREFSRYILPAMRLLARLRGLRGTRLDPFGWTAERRMERALIPHYEALVDIVLRRLRVGNIDAASALLSLADQVRGYGPVKTEAIDLYYEQVRAGEMAFLSEGSTVSLMASMI